MKISIITVNYNDKIGLEATIKSVKSQSIKDFEFIVVDGDSTDGSKEVIRTNNCITSWISEKDNGIYHAMNKGTRMANGDFLLYLNAGDTLYENNTLEKVIPYLKEDVGIIYGDINYVGQDYSWVKDYGKENINFDFFVHDTLPHQATFIKKNILQSLEYPYDETLKICADWKFFIDAIIKNTATHFHIPIVISNYNFDGFSSKPENRPIIITERLNILLKDYNKLFCSAYDKLLNDRYAYQDLLRSRIIKRYISLKRLLKNK